MLKIQYFIILDNSGHSWKNTYNFSFFSASTSALFQSLGLEGVLSAVKDYLTKTVFSQSIHEKTESDTI